MTDKEKIKVEIERMKESGCASPIVICDTLLTFIDSLQEEPNNVYVVTRCEGLSDYVEKVFFDKSKAAEYCKQFEGNDNEYSRGITKVKATL